MEEVAAPVRIMDVHLETIQTMETKVVLETQIKQILMVKVIWIQQQAKTTRINYYKTVDLKIFYAFICFMPNNDNIATNDIKYTE